MASELKWSVLTFLLIVLSFVVPGGRVLTIPFVFVFIIILIFWSARVSAEREER